MLDRFIHIFSRMFPEIMAICCSVLILFAIFCAVVAIIFAGYAIFKKRIRRN